jgi:hypothetical protein
MPVSPEIPHMLEFVWSTIKTVLVGTSSGMTTFDTTLVISAAE